MEGSRRRRFALPACALSLLAAGALTATTVFAAGTWVQKAKLTIRDSAGFDHIGFSIGMSHDGQTALLGTPTHNDFRGAAYVFDRTASGWVQSAKLTAGDISSLGTAFRIDFGWAVALSDDGSTAVVGAPDRNLLTGAVYVFTRSGSTWTQVAEFTAKSPKTFSEFGTALAVSHDGRTIVVGAPQENSFAGAVYVFSRGASGWVQRSRLAVSDTPDFLGFGSSVAMGQDGQSLIVGAPKTAGFSGAAYVFVRSGSSWVQTAALGSGVTDGLFGQSVDLSHDSDVALVGAPQSSNVNGAAYVFTRTGAVWQQTAVLTAGDAGVDDYFGFSVALGHDAETALIGAPNRDAFTGAAYAFGRIGTQWTQRSVLTANDGVSGDDLGFTVALARDRFIALVGAVNEDRNGSTFDSGAAYIFTR